MADESDVAGARRLLADARRVSILTGAGVSAESGVPTFRGHGGLWRSHRPEELATPEAFGRDPQLVWEWYAWRREMVAACVPNAGHRAIARFLLSRSGSGLVTQNVDALHEEAAEMESADDPSPALPLHLHGSLFEDRCTNCLFTRDGRERTVDASSPATLPRCPECDALLRPAVVWFGEALDGAVLEEAFQQAGAADVCLVVGTSAVVHPAASVPLATLRSGGAVVEVNPEPTSLTPHAAYALRGPAGQLLPRLLGA